MLLCKGGAALTSSATAPYSTFAHELEKGKWSSATPRAPQRPSPGALVKNSSRTSKQDRDSAVALFQDVVNHRHTELSDENVHAVSADWQFASRLRALAEKGGLDEPAAGLDLFKTDLTPYLETLRGPIPKPIHSFARLYLSRVVRDVTARGLVGHSLDISRLYALLGDWDSEHRNALVLNLCCLAMAHDPQSSDTALAAVHELIDMWKHLSQLGRPSQVGQPLKFALPPKEDILADLKRVRYVPGPGGTDSSIHATDRALVSLLLQMAPKRVAALMPGLAASVVVLHRFGALDSKVRADAEPLLTKFALVLQRKDVSLRWIEAKFKSSAHRLPEAQNQLLLEEMTANWRTTVDELKKTYGTRMEEQQAQFKQRLQQPVTQLANLHKRLRTAHRGRDKAAIIKIWRSLGAEVARNDKLVDHLKADPEHLDYWIFVWCAIRNPQYLQETLKFMAEIGLDPSIKTYTAMMHGWKVAKDFTKIEALWKTLVESGTKLDPFVWAERISAQVSAGKPQAALAALGEMMRLYQEAVNRGRPEEAVQPTIDVVNAAVTQLIRTDKQAALEVLQWAGEKGIHPNVYTYNILIGASLRGEFSQSVPELLQSMWNQGLEPDSATFTIILEEMFQNMHHSTKEEQTEAVNRVFNDMEASGKKLTYETYGKLVHAIASLPEGGADDAIAAVQTHMRKNHLKLTPHIVTILIERLLLREQPKKTAIDALLRDNGFDNVSKGDQTLWERAMTAYALTHDIPAAMRLFDQLAAAERPVTSLHCLTTLLQALLGEEAIEEARRVISTVLAHKRATGEDISGREQYWRHRLWWIAQEHGLLHEQNLPPALVQSLKDG